MVKYQRSSGRAHLGENPWTSRAWKEVPIQAAYEGEAYGRCDMCRYGLKHPGTGRKLKKPTCIAGTPEIVEACAARCRRELIRLLSLLEVTRKPLPGR